eukprot:8921171-Alexandrium_andersonii.AAC.1
MAACGQRRLPKFCGCGTCGFPRAAIVVGHGGFGFAARWPQRYTTMVASAAQRAFAQLSEVARQLGVQVQ